MKSIARSKPPLRTSAMLQTFHSQSEPERVAERVKAFAPRWHKSKIDAVLVPRADKHQGEYVPASAERLKWLTGFSGSAGIAVVAKRSAVLMIDGRYTVQAGAETEPRHFEVSLFPRANSPNGCPAIRKRPGHRLRPMEPHSR